MAETIVYALQQQRMDTAANWAANNPVLLEGEIGIEGDTGKFKFGNGTAAWNGLPYVVTGGGGERKTLIHQTNQLAARAWEDFTITVSSLFNLLGLSVSSEVWLRIYGTEAARDADIRLQPGQSIGINQECYYEIVTTGALAIRLAPVPLIQPFEGKLYVRLLNRASVNKIIGLELFVFLLEGGSFGPIIDVETGSYPDPITSLTPVLWYDFSDESTVSISDGAVASVGGKGTRSWTLSKSATGPQYVTGINGRKCIDWGNTPHSNSLGIFDTTATDIAEVYVVLDASYGSAFPNFNGLFGGAAEPINFAGWGGTAGFYTADPSSSWNAVYINNSISNTINNVLPSINNPCIMRINNLNGSARTLQAGFRVGMDRGNPGRGWYGLIGEFIAFSAQLSAGDRSIVMNWLAGKWAITLS